MKMRWIVRRLTSSEPEVVVYDTETHEVTASPDIETMIDLYDDGETLVETWFALNYAVADLEDPAAAWGVINAALDFMEREDKTIEVLVMPPPFAKPEYADTDIV